MVLFIFVVMILNREEVAPVALRGLFWRAIGVAAGIYLVFVFGRVVYHATARACRCPARPSAR